MFFNKTNTWQQTTFDQKSSPGLFWIRLNDDTSKNLNLGVIKILKAVFWSLSLTFYLNARYVFTQIVQWVVCKNKTIPKHYAQKIVSA